MRQLKISLAMGVSLGFVLILILLAIFTLTGMAQMSAINQHVNHLVNYGAAKVELAHKMIDSVNERTISIHVMTQLTDPFDMDDEHIKFLTLGDKFVAARGKLLKMDLSEKERDILKQVRQQAAKNRPFIFLTVQSAIDGQSRKAQKMVNNQISPRQRKILHLLEKLLQIQRNDTQAMVKATEEGYQNSRLIMLILGVTVGALGFLTALAVVRYTNRQSKLLRHQALYDGLTGSPNRILFADRLQQTMLTYHREKKSFGLIVMDLDLFKEINDNYGHQAGDDVLISVARAVQSCLRESDTVARMGGDEFSILLPSSRTVLGTVAVAKRIVEKLHNPIIIQGHELEIGASMGLAQFPNHAETVDKLQSNADSAMYQAKRGHTGYAVYNDGMDQKVDDVAKMHAALRKAITKGELILHYQPKIEFSTHTISGVEALVRWQHPTRGLIPPDDFIPFAENSELIKPLTEYVLREAVKQTADWLKGGVRLSVAVNVSAINIQDDQFPALVVKILDEYQLPAELLELELTESAVMSKPELAVKCIRQLHDRGVHVSIDDFGTGYTSMSQLKDLLVTKIKIDKSFVKNMTIDHNDAVIVRTTVDLSHNLGFKVVAEGVEDQATWDQLEILGCDSAQGFHMARPLAPEAFIDWLNSSSWSGSANK